MKKHYLIYKIKNLINEKIYIGYHVTNNINDGYMGSGCLIQKAVKKYGKENFEKIILFDFDTKEEMLAKEEELVDWDFANRCDTYNLVKGGKGNWRPTTGKVVVQDLNGNRLLVNCNDSRYLSGELISIHKGKISVKDKDGNTMQVSKDDSRYISGELVSCWTGRKMSKEHKQKIGEKNSIKQKGKGNSQYGTCWIYNLELKENKKIKKDELQSWLDQDWIKGRKQKF